MENIAYVQFESVEVAKKYKEMDLEINSVPISSKFVPDRMSAERKRTKGTKWENKKAAKREAIIAEKKAEKQEAGGGKSGLFFYSEKLDTPKDSILRKTRYSENPNAPKKPDTPNFSTLRIL